MQPFLPLIVVLYVFLVLASVAYTVLLHELRNSYMPHWTWLATATGNALCLACPTVIALIVPLSAVQVIALVWLAFAVGGVPIAVWRVTARAIERSLIRQRRKDRGG